MSTPAMGTAGPSKPSFKEKLGSKATCGRRRKSAVLKGAFRAALRLAGDQLAAASMRLRGPEEPGGVIPPQQLVEKWREVAQAEALPLQTHLDRLCYFTLAGWGQINLSERITCWDCWGYTAQRFPTAFSLPRPLLRALGKTLRRHAEEATVAELNLVAVRCGPFMRTPVADLARNVLDAVIQECAGRVHQDYKLAATMGPVMSMGAYASRTDSTQSQLHQLRQAASDARDPLEETIYQRVAILKTSLLCDSITARSRVAASLAKDTLEQGGDIRAVFAKHFPLAGQALEAQHEDALAETEAALEEWRSQQVALQVAAGSKAGDDSLSMCTVHSDGRSEASMSP